ncbi:hypothetical protein AB4Z22_24005 [Paenibacillus sp. TAF58]
MSDEEINGQIGRVNSGKGGRKRREEKRREEKRREEKRVSTLVQVNWCRCR